MGDEAKKEGQQNPEKTKPVELSDQDLELAAGGGKAGRADFNEIVIVKYLDKATPKLHD